MLISAAFSTLQYFPPSVQLKGQRQELDLHPCSLGANMGKPKANSGKQQSAELPGVKVDYVYDPSRRRTQAYSDKEIQRLSASHRARLERNRELAKASKERKKQRLVHLQQSTSELGAAVQQLKADLVAKQQALMHARAATDALLVQCGCDACSRVQTRLHQLTSTSCLNQQQGNMQGGGS